MKWRSGRVEGWEDGKMGGWKIGSAKPFRAIKTLIGVIDLEVWGPSQPWNSVKKLLSSCAAPRD
jgi:hypothetical protein